MFYKKERFIKKKTIQEKSKQDSYFFTYFFMNVKHDK